MLDAEEQKKSENIEKTVDEERSSSLIGVQSDKALPIDMEQSALHGVQPDAPESLRGYIPQNYS